MNRKQRMKQCEQVITFLEENLKYADGLAYAQDLKEIHHLRQEVLSLRKRK